jgi:hypothetical protein
MCKIEMTIDLCAHPILRRIYVELYISGESVSYRWLAIYIVQDSCLSKTKNGTIILNVIFVSFLL